MNLIGENITYKPDDQFHLNDVSFNFKKGNLYTILGRTLSGKTTFLKTIAGLLNPDSGNLSFEEKDFSKIPVWERNVATFLSQTGILLKSFSSKDKFPLSGFSKPAIVFRKVVFPDKVLPKIVYRFPFLKLKDTSFK